MKFTYSILVFASAALIACSGQDDTKSTVPTTPVSPVPTTGEAGDANVAFSSVQMLEDCPDPAPATPASGMSPDDSSAVYQDCMQSTIQIAFAAQGEGSSQIALREVRLATPEGKVLGTIAHRLPTVWQDNGYVTWDQVLPGDTELKAAYKITPPNWQEVEKMLGTGSYGEMFVLEMDVEIGGVMKTLRSSQFTRQQPMAVPT